MLNPSIILHHKFKDYLRSNGLTFNAEQLNYRMNQLLMCFIYYDWHEKGTSTSNIAKNPVGMGTSNYLKTINQLVGAQLITRQRLRVINQVDNGRPPYTYKFSPLMLKALESVKWELDRRYEQNVFNAFRALPKLANTNFSLKEHVLNCVFLSSINEQGTAQFDSHESLAFLSGLKETELKLVIEQWLIKSNSFLIVEYLTKELTILHPLSYNPTYKAKAKAIAHKKSIIIQLHNQFEMIKNLIAAPSYKSDYNRQLQIEIFRFLIISSFEKINNKTNYQSIDTQKHTVYELIRNITDSTKTGIPQEHYQKELEHILNNLILEIDSAIELSTLKSNTSISIKTVAWFNQIPSDIIIFFRFD